MNSTCPAPFIRTKFASNTTVISLLSERRLCWKVDCCLPCIYNKVIYDTAAFDTVLYVSTISMCLMLLHLLLLLLFPITFVRTKYSMGLSVALIFFHAPEAIGLIAGKNNVLCNDATQPATGDTNLLCLLQGSMVVYGVMSTHAWGAMRICALYSALAFKKVLTGKAVTLSMTFVCSVLPLVPVMVGIAFHANGYHGGHLCMPAQTIRGFLTMWIPITMIATPVIVIHFMTFFKIARTFRNRKARQGTVGPSVFAGRGVDPAQDEKGRLARLASNRPVENSVLAFWALEWRPFISMSMVAVMTSRDLIFTSADTLDDISNVSLFCLERHTQWRRLENQDDGVDQMPSRIQWRSRTMQVTRHLVGRSVEIPFVRGLIPRLRWYRDIYRRSLQSPHPCLGSLAYGQETSSCRAII